MINGHSIPTYGYWLGGLLLLLGVIGLVCIGMLIGRAGRQEEIDDAYQVGYAKGREVGYGEGEAHGKGLPVQRRDPLTMLIPRLPPDATQPIGRIGGRS